MTHIRDLEYYIYVASSQIKYISITSKYISIISNCHSDIMQIMNQLWSTPASLHGGDDNLLPQGME